ncbi:MAG: protein-export chaperone SecB [Alphaproteobacteria bacterium]|nr:protein-export chaperone SecB [Alphaproteobacteria bacterium]
MAQDETGRTAPNGSSDAVAPERPQLHLNAQYVTDLSFENPRAPQTLLQPKGQPEVSVEVDVKARNLGPELYEVLLKLGAEAKIEGEAVFIVEVTYAGVVTIRNASPEMISALLFIETPRLLFPFARSIISAATRDGGFPPLLVNPIDFADLLRRQQAGAAKSGEVATA